ncbi:ABC transporter ATP-binding protein [Nakamurella sp. YIM 132084]|uniref:ABC transporter ATP-binding protein n=1 Tax=Nakamurella leprariae TaxID=2803911 RepID=A0A939BVN5_9ACTN|nr:ABC transporter ATP-binding protein [Nakamurella leprariae]
MLHVQSLHIDYASGGRLHPAVRGVDFTVGAGEVVAVVGESGSGKSTTAHAVLGLLPPEGLITAGAIRFRGQDIARLSERRFRSLRGAEISLVPQDPTVSLNPVTRIGDQIAEGLRIHEKLPRRAARLAAADLLDAVGIDRPLVRSQQYPHELSGGMRQRVLIAIALACDPALIVADEPTSGLDVTVQRTVLDKLQQLTHDRGTSVLLITHDLGVAVDRADRIVVMQAGEVVETGPATEVTRQPRHEYTQRLVAAAPSLHSDRLTATAGIVATASASPPGARPADPIERRADEFVRVTDVRRQFRVVLPDSGRVDLVAVDGVSFSIARGSTFALVGESGSGKSTTARLVGGLDSPTSGSITIDGADLEQLSRGARRALRSRVQFVHQNPYASLDPRFSLYDIIEEPLRAFGVGSGRDRQARVTELLEHIALPASYLRRRPGELSGGQRQRTAIARALVLRPELVILDEPVSALDVSVQAQILQLLTDLQVELGLTYLFISHDLAVVRQISDRVGVMQQGRLVEQATTAELFAAPADDYTRRLLDAIPGSRARG